MRRAPRSGVFSRHDLLARAAANLPGSELVRRGTQTSELVPRYRGTFRQFIRDYCPSYHWAPHTERLVDRLQQVERGEIRHLIVQMPPRHYKSTTTSRLFPAYYLRKHPDRFAAIGCHAAELAEEFSGCAADYYRASGGIIPADQAAKKRWGTGLVGGCWGSGVSGGGTGRPAHLWSIDDPVKNPETADSPAYQRRLVNWWESVVWTRREPGCAICVVQTRWCDADLIGALLQREAEVVELNQDHNALHWWIVDMPAIALPPEQALEVPRTCQLEPDPREPGEALDPARFPLSDLESTRAQLNAGRWWEALYQGRPSRGELSIFHRSDFSYYQPEQLEPGPEQLSFHQVIASLDAAFKGKEQSDHVALTVWGVIWTQDTVDAYLLDVIDRQMGFTRTLEALDDAHEEYLWNEILVEDRANGSAILDTMTARAVGYAVTSVDPLGGKIPRAEACSPMFAQHRVHFPATAEWLRRYEAQLIKFPLDKRDDMVDSTTQLLNYVGSTRNLTMEGLVYGRGVQSVTSVMEETEAPTHRSRRSNRIGFR